MEQVKLNKERLNELKELLDMSSLTLDLEWFKIERQEKVAESPVVGLINI